MENKGKIELAAIETYIAALTRKREYAEDKIFIYDFGKLSSEKALDYIDAELKKWEPKAEKLRILYGK